MAHMIGSNTLDKPAVSVSHTSGEVTIVGERMAVVIPMPHDSLSQVSEFHHWHYHDTLYHSDDHDSEYHDCEVCEEFGETEL